MFHKLSIRFKLVVLLAGSAALALLVSSLITSYTTYVTESRASLRVLQQLTSVISENMRAALAFHDVHSAGNILAPLRVDSHILLAVVTDDVGKVWSQYRHPTLSKAQGDAMLQHVRDTITAESQKLFDQEATVEHLHDDCMGVLQTVWFDGKPIGVLAVISDTQRLRTKIRDFILVQLSISLLTLVVLVFLSVRLQALFTRPILDLVAAMHSVAATKDYRHALSVQRSDEFGELYEGFDAMLAEVRERDERLSKLATTDALTGLANRRHAMDVLATMLARSQRKGEPLGVVMLDIDFFKKVNDHYGHPAGDLVLQTVARVLQDSAREYDLVARFGGEEFLVICEGATVEMAAAVAERIRSSVQEYRINLQGDGFLYVTVSLGVHARTPSADDALEGVIESMIKTADEAMYRAKESGRNRFVVG
ncbi:GGDEF domain protein [Candidatus Symbiobacter mobilis CR]|uniref:diguanylate cyclase n=2 Tax=Candidatus Symbiobacter TaxID=1436289 RepID=U5N737_9BURK|nr:GGDEF domain protein [Candidatus Symbiobacter mobilis CR]